MRKLKLFITVLVLAFMAASPAQAWTPPSGPGWKSMRVTVTAYCSFPDQTSSHPYLAAWNDELVPGMKAVAVSPDLIPLGLGHEAVVYIEGLEGPYRVLDKTNPEWKFRIDLYYGLDEQGALDWGRQERTIYWRPDGG